MSKSTHTIELEREYLKGKRDGAREVIEWVEKYNINAKGYFEYPLEIPGGDYQALREKIKGEE